MLPWVIHIGYFSAFSIFKSLNNVSASRRCKCMQQRVIHRRAESVSHTLQPKKLSATQQVASKSDVILII